MFQGEISGYILEPIEIENIPSYLEMRVLKPRKSMLFQKKLTEFHQKPDLLLKALSIIRLLPSSMTKVQESVCIPSQV